MLRYTFVTERNPVFRRFIVFRIQVGVLMWMTIFFELLVAITQFYHLLYNEAQLSKESPPILSAIHIGLMFGSLAFVVLPFAVWGVLSIRAVYCLPYLLFCFVSMFEVLALFVFGLVDYEETRCGIHLYNGIWFLSILPFHVFSTVVTLAFVVFAQNFSNYVRYEKHITNADCLFQLERQRGLIEFKTSSRAQRKTQQLTPSTVAEPPIKQVS